MARDWLTCDPARSARAKSLCSLHLLGYARHGTRSRLRSLTALLRSFAARFVAALRFTPPSHHNSRAATHSTQTNPKRGAIGAERLPHALAVPLNVSFGRVGRICASPRMEGKAESLNGGSERAATGGFARTMGASGWCVRRSERRRRDTRPAFGTNNGCSRITTAGRAHLRGTTFTFINP